jgi:AcrR family transcriptional regulator
MNMSNVGAVPEDVKQQARGRRKYDASRRQAAAAETRRRILDAARALFDSEGYAATTVAAIAQRAGVATDTVYATVGPKPVLFRELVETALSGTDRAVAGRDRDYAVRMRTEPDARRKLAIYAAAVTELQGRLAPLFLVLREAAAGQQELNRLWREITERRARNMRQLASDVIGTGAVRSDLTLDEVADVIWTMNSAEYYAMLVLDRGWSAQRFEAWLYDAWCRLLLE